MFQVHPATYSFLDLADAGGVAQLRLSSEVKAKLEGRSQLSQPILWTR